MYGKALTPWCAAARCAIPGCRRASWATFAGPSSARRPTWRVAAYRSGRVSCCSTPACNTASVTTGKLEEWLQADPNDPEGPLPSLPAQPAALTSSNLEGLIHAALRDLGLAFLPDFTVREALAAGTLQAVLGDYTQESGHFSVLWPAHRQVSPRLRVWLDSLCARLSRRRRESLGHVARGCPHPKMTASNLAWPSIAHALCRRGLLSVLAHGGERTRCRCCHIHGPPAPK